MDLARTNNYECRQLTLTISRRVVRSFVSTDHFDWRGIDAHVECSRSSLEDHFRRHVPPHVFTRAWSSDGSGLFYALTATVIKLRTLSAGGIYTRCDSVMYIRRISQPWTLTEAFTSSYKCFGSGSLLARSSRFFLRRASKGILLLARGHARVFTPFFVFRRPIDRRCKSDGAF